MTPPGRRAGHGRPACDERGVATVHAAFLTLLAALVCAVALHVVAVARLQHEVTAAADLAALAASRDAATGGEGCDAAARVATANGARLATCSLAEAAATVEVERSARLWGHPVSVRRTARAAPRDYVPAEEGS